MPDVLLQRFYERFCSHGFKSHISAARPNLDNIQQFECWKVLYKVLQQWWGIEWIREQDKTCAGSNIWGPECAEPPPAPSLHRQSSPVRSLQRAINWTQTEPTQRGNYSSQLYNSSCSFPPIIFYVWAFFCTDCNTRHYTVLGRTKRHSWKQTWLSRRRVQGYWQNRKHTD